MPTVFGWYGHSNTGDESYKLTFPKLAPGYSFRFTDNPSDCDSLILGGGDILSSSFLEKCQSIKADRKIIVSASASKATPFHLLAQFDQIFIRDSYSENLLKNNGIKSRYMPDLAFLLKPSPDAGRSFVKNMFASEGLELRKARVGVIVNSYLADHGDAILARDFLTYQKFCYDFAKIADNTNASFIFIPMGTRFPTDDRVSNSIVASRCKFSNKNLCIFGRLSVQETLNIISSLDCVISTRLHSTIFSIIGQVPFIDVLHHDKNRKFLETLFLDDCGTSYWHFDSEWTMYRLRSILNDPEPYKKKIGAVYQQQMDIIGKEITNVHIFK